MNHQPFNEWIYQDAPLTEQDEHELKAHLKTCPVCQDNDKAWQDVNGMLKSAPMMPAAPGFVNRWQASLADRRQKELRRQVWMGFLILSGAFLLTLALIILFIILNHSPVSLFTQVFESLTGAWLVFLEAKASITHWLQTIPPLLIGAGLLVFASWCTVLVLAWNLVFRISSRKGIPTK